MEEDEPKEPVLELELDNQLMGELLIIGHSYNLKEIEEGREKYLLDDQRVER